ncbi:MAG: amino acid permease [Chloroflexota bacterium]
MSQGPRSREEIIREDVRELHRMGYAQELFRSMGGFSNFAISFSIISILTGAVILYNYGLALAGPAASGIGWPLVTVFTILIAAAMAEIASAYPTAGGLYYWASRLRNKDWGWWVAWLNLGGQVSIVAGIDYAAAIYLGVTILDPLFGIDPNVETLGVLNSIWICGVLMIVQVIFNIAGTRIVAFLNDLSVYWHIGFVIAIAVGLFALGTVPTHSLDFLFQVAPGGSVPGATPDAAPIPVQAVVPLGMFGAFMLGLLQAQWTYTGYDASAHVAEETVNAKLASGWGVFLSVAVSAIFGFILLAAVTLKMTSVDDVLTNAPGGYGVAYILYQNLGSSLTSLGGILAAGIAVAMSLCGFSSIASASRMLFAFSRDDGVPFSRWLKRISHRYRTPANAIVAITALSWLLIAGVYVLVKAIGGDPFFIIAGITGVSTVLLYWAYGLCILLGMIGDQSWRTERVWSLGRLSRPVAIVAVLWVAVLTPLFLWPLAVYNPAALPTVLVFLGFLLVYYIAWGRRRFRGPHAQGGERELTEIEMEFESEATRLAHQPA